jgi:hypothetical protein
MSGYPASMRDAAQRQGQAANPALLVRAAAANRAAVLPQQQHQQQQPAPAPSAPQPFGRGNKVMGGLGVGPSGEAQQPLMSAQYSVSGARGRRADTLSAEQQTLPGGAMRPRRPQERVGSAATTASAAAPNSIEQYQRQMQADDQARRGAAQAVGGGGGDGDGASILSAPDGGRRMLLTYNSASAPSMETFNAIVSRSTQPHPRLFDWSVEIVDINAPRLPPQSEAIVRQLRQMPLFQREIIENCVLFDRLKKIAYKELQHIFQVIQAQKDNIVAALVEQQQSGGGVNVGDNAAGNGAAAERRGLVREHHSVTQPGAPEKSIKAISRRSVLHGVDPGKLDDIARHEERRIRRDPGGGGGGGVHSISMRRGAGGGGGDDGGDAGGIGIGGTGDMSGVGGTMFEGMGGAYNAAAVAYGGGRGEEGNSSGFLPQITVNRKQKQG